MGGNPQCGQMSFFLGTNGPEKFDVIKKKQYIQSKPEHLWVKSKASGPDQSEQLTLFVCGCHIIFPKLS